MVFIGYEKCSTCRKAKKFLEEKGASFSVRDIKTENPARGEILEWHERSGLPLDRFFNTSGRLYRELKLKDRLPAMSDGEKAELLASDGMLVKRPVLIGEDFVLIGFREAEWSGKIG